LTGTAQYEKYPAFAGYFFARVQHVLLVLFGNEVLVVCASRQTTAGNLHKLKVIGANKGAISVPWQGVMLKAVRLAKISDAVALLAPKSRRIPSHRGIAMNNFNIKALAVAITLAFSAGAMAQNVTKTEYKAGKDKISAEYKTAKAACSSLSGNANDICVIEAKGAEKIATAALEAAYKPTTKNFYEVRVAKVAADYGVAKEKCDDLSGNTKDVCVKEAKAVETTAKAEAKAQLKTTDANATANEKSAEAQSKANDTSKQARKDATADEIDASYAVAKEKCDTFAGGAKDTCMDQAKKRFGKS